MIFLHWLLGSIGICLGIIAFNSPKLLPKWLEYDVTLGALSDPGTNLGVADTVCTMPIPKMNTKTLTASRFLVSHMLWILLPRSEFFDQEVYKKYAPDRLAHLPMAGPLLLLLQIPLGLLLYGLGGWSL